MTEQSRPPSRLLDQPNSPLERALLRAGSELRASETARAGVLRALSIEPLEMAGSHVGITRPRALFFRPGALLLAAMVMSAAAVAIPLVRGAMSEKPLVPPVGQRDLLRADGAAEATRSQDGLSAGASASPSSSSSLPPDVPAAKTSAATDEPGAARSGSRAAAPNALAVELAALDAARGKLNAGEPRPALLLLDAYQRDFPRPRLALEAEVLRIDALDRSGQVEAARKRAAAFVQSHPKGVLTGRVRRYLEK